MTEPYPLHEGDMALELAEREFHSTVPLHLLQLATAHHGADIRFNEVLDIAEKLIQEKWIQKASDDPQAVRTEYETTIGLDGFPGAEGGDVQ